MRDKSRKRNSMISRNPKASLPFLYPQLTGLIILVEPTPHNHQNRLDRGDVGGETKVASSNMMHNDEAFEKFEMGGDSSFNRGKGSSGSKVHNQAAADQQSVLMSPCSCFYPCVSCVILTTHFLQTTKLAEQLRNAHMTRFWMGSFRFMGHSKYMDVPSFVSKSMFHIAS